MNIIIKNITVVYVVMVILSSGTSLPQPDSAGHVKPPKGLSYGGIPYGSVSGNVAEYFRNNPPPSNVRPESYNVEPSYVYV